MSRENVIKQLSDVEHVRQRPGMYVGSASLETREMWAFDEKGRLSHRPVNVVTGLLKLFDEIISNSIDEAYRLDFSPPRSRTRRFEIRVETHRDGNSGDTLGLSVSDNGRGIPLDPLKAENCDNPALVGKPQALVALTALRSGTNFEKENTEWVSIGTHGLGATLVNILSSRFEANITSGTQQLILSCKNGKIDYHKLTDSKKRSGTTITWIPDFSILGGIDSLDGDHLDAIKRRVYDLSIAFPQIDFYFDGIKYESRTQDSISMYMNRIHEESVSHHGKSWRMGVCPSEEQRHIFLVNGIDAYEGGTPLDYARNKVVDQVVAFIKKKHKLTVKPADVRSKICFVLFVDGVSGLKFRSQSKEFVTNPASDFSHLFEDLDPEVIARRIAFNPEIIDPIIETYKLKEKAKEKVELKRKKRQLSKIRVIDHVPAIGKDPRKKVLFVTEGKSAIGRLEEVRDSEIHGGYPLRGKPLNVSGKTRAAVMKNKEISELVGIIGLDPVGGYDPEDLNYGIVAIMADADVDGDSIACLLVNLFISYWPEFVNDERLCIVRSPLLKVEKGNKRELFYREQDYLEVQRTGKIDGWEVTYLKGLGSLTPDAYREMITSPMVELVTTNGDHLLDTVFGPSADLRKGWLMSNEVLE